MKTQNEINSIKNDYETFKQFVAEYPRYFELAQKYKKNPGELLNFFTSIGEEILSRSVNEIFNSQNISRIKDFVPSKIKISDDTINALDSLITFLKENNRK
jgi:hypothetical protein